MNENKMKKLLTFFIIIVVALAVIFFVRRRGLPIDAEMGGTNPETLAELSEGHQEYIGTLIGAIRSGGPPKDGIPAVDVPDYESLAEADTWLVSDDVVFGVESGGQAYAFPQRILVWHEIANITFDDRPASVTYCPLTGTAIGYLAPDPDVNDPTLGVSGKLVNSNLIMYDRGSDSYWPQILGGAITGEKVGESLAEFPVVWTTWEKWKTAHPETMVMSRKTGYFRNYGEGGDPYGSYLGGASGYYLSDAMIFAPIHQSDELRPKDVVVGLRDAERNAVAVLKDVLRERKEMEVTLGERMVRLTYLEGLDSHSAEDIVTGEWVNSFDSMWFPWFSYFPETELIKD